jgi:hypothetical protein
MTTNTFLSMALSQEELFVIMIYLKGESLPGFDKQIIMNLDKDQLDLIVSVAERALISRNFLKPIPEGRLELNPNINAIIRTCMYPEKSLIITRIRPDFPEEDYFFHTSGKLNVMHSIPLTTIHQFISVEEKSAIVRTAISILSMGSHPKLKCTEGQLNLSVLEKARDAAKEKGAKEAIDILSLTDLNKETIRKLSQTLTQPIANTTFAYISVNGPIDGFSIFQGINGFWLIEPKGDPTNELISIFPVSSDNITHRIKTMLIN